MGKLAYMRVTGDPQVLAETVRALLDHALHSRAQQTIRYLSRAVTGRECGARERRF
jgi:hypothetical protein